MAPIPHPRAALLALLALALAPGGAAAPSARARVDAPRVELAPGPCADAWARAAGWSAPRVAFEPAGGTPIALDADAWLRPETWSGWTGLLGRLAQQPEAGRSGAAAERAALATLALRQARWDDAWRHLARVDDARELERLMPSFLPGVAAGTDVTAPLEDGALLRPAAPPPSPDARPGFVDRREAWLRGLVVGAATLDLRIAIEADGVQVDVVHTQGGAARLSLVVPAPTGFDVRYEYVDWQRREETGAPLELVLAAGETRTVYGSTQPAWSAWPASPAPGELPAAARAGELWLVSAAGPAPDAVDARLAALARGLAELFDIECSAGPAEARALCVAVHLDGRDDGRERRLATLASAVEAFVLAGR